MLTSMLPCTIQYERILAFHTAGCSVLISTIHTKGYWLMLLGGDRKDANLKEWIIFYNSLPRDVEQRLKIVICIL